jgi:hypothetical protein
MTTFIVLVVGAAVGLHNGLGFEAGWSLIMAVVGVGAMMLWVKPRGTGDHRVIVQDMNTGETKYQPMDNDTVRYLNTRKNRGDN